MVYNAEVTTNTTYNECYGTSEEGLKSRYNNHTQSLDTCSILMIRNYLNVFGN